MALDETRSVSGAATRLRRSQPSVSLSLGELRSVFDGLLFVHAGYAAHASRHRVVASARAVLLRIGEDFGEAREFEPLTSDRTVTLALSDVGKVVFLPTPLKHVRQDMPKAMVRAVSPQAREVARQLESGDVDLAIGYFPDLQKHNGLSASTVLGSLSRACFVQIMR